MRKAELTGQVGKQADGTAKTREVKLCTVWSAEGGTPRACRSGIRARSPTRLRSSARPRATRDRDGVGLRASAWSARPIGAASMAPPASFSATGRPGSEPGGEAFPAARQIVDRFHVQGTPSEVATVAVTARRAISGMPGHGRARGARRGNPRPDRGRLGPASTRTRRDPRQAARVGPEGARYLDESPRSVSKLPRAGLRCLSGGRKSGMARGSSGPGCIGAFGGQRDYRLALLQAERSVSRTSGSAAPRRVSRHERDLIILACTQELGSPTWRYRIGPGGSSYEIDEERKLVLMTAADHRSSAYM